MIIENWNYLLLKLFNIKAELVHGFIALFLNSQINHCISKRSAHVEFKREIVHAFGVFLIVVLLCSDPATDHVIFDSVSESTVEVVRCSDISVLDKSEVEMPIEGFFNVIDALKRGNPAD